MANATRVAAAMLTLFPALAAEANVPKANCRASDKAETGLQGLTTQAEIDSGAAKAGFNCNADVVGQYQGEGASWQLTAWKNCAYFDQRLNSAEANPGTVVVDVSDPKNPKPTVWLGAQAPAFIDPWESLKVNAARQLLGAGQRPTGTTFPGTGFAIYDISQDCAHPTLKSSIDITGSFGHTGQWAPDGNTYYITRCGTTSASRRSTPRIPRSPSRLRASALRPATAAARTVSSPPRRPSLRCRGGTTWSSRRTGTPRTSPCSASATGQGRRAPATGSSSSTSAISRSARPTRCTG